MIRVMLPTTRGHLIAGVALSAILSSMASAQTVPDENHSNVPSTSAAQSPSQNASSTPISPSGTTSAPMTGGAPVPTSTDGGASALGEIVVTARRVAENLQKVPASVGTLEPKALQARQIFGLTDIKSAVAGLTTTATPVPGGAFFTIRGVASNSLPTPSADSAVGFYFDGVYIARNEGQGIDNPDLAQIEVLRGPQGTLFGRNTAAGAVNLISNVPVQKQELKYDVLYGNYNQFRASIIANMPITNDLAVRVSYLHREIRGDVRNNTAEPGRNYVGFDDVRPVSRYDAVNHDSVIARIRYTGISGLTLDYKYDYANLDDAVQPNQTIAYQPDQNVAGVNALLGFLLPSQTGTIVQSFNRLTAVPAGSQGPARTTNQGHLFTAEYAVDDHLTLKNISAWRKLSASLTSDYDSGDWTLQPLSPAALCLACASNNVRQSQFSQEDQVIGKFDKFNFIAGGYYFVEHSRFKQFFSVFGVIPLAPTDYNIPTTPFTTFLGSPIPGPLAIGEVGQYRNRSYAGYLHGDYALNDVFKLSAGGRYTIDKRFTDDLRSFGAGAQNVTYKRFTYDGAINAQLDPNKLLYARYATGYVSGGIFGNIAFKPESDQQVEAGFKTEWLDRTLRINGAAYYTWRKNIQSALSSLNPAVNPTLAGQGISPPYPIGLLIINTPGTSTVKGFEIETTYIPTPGLSLNANFAYNDPSYSDHSLNTAPKTQFSFSGEYEFPHFANGSFVSVRVDGDYRGKYYGNGLNVRDFWQGVVNPALLARFGYGPSDSDAYDAAARKATTAGNYWLLNGRMSLNNFNIGGSQARLSGFVQNMLNTHGLLYAVNLNPLVDGSFERPRTYGLELNLDF